MFETLSLAADGGVARLWLQRPDKLNALSPLALAELSRAALQLRERDDLRVLIIGGRGRAFCAGADLEGMPSTADGSVLGLADAGRLMADALESLPAVTIARLHGWCVGGGLVLAAACDLRVAQRGTRFAIPEVDLGIPLTWGGIPRLVREIGPALTKELVMTCRPFDADEALRAGFLNRVVDEEDLDAAVDTLARDICARPRMPVAATKQHVNAVTSAAVGLVNSWSDAAGLAAALADEECNRRREHYLAKRGA
jgi:enoyl-CoA hydratase/carnithine racemase